MDGDVVVNFEGTWNVTIATPIGKQRVVLAIESDNGQLRGRATQGDETVSFEDVVADGDRLRWTQHVTKPLRLTVRFDVRVEAHTLSGTAKAGLFPSSPVTGERARQDG